VCLISDGSGADQDTVRLITLLGAHNTGYTDAFTRGRGQLLPVLSYDPQAASRLTSQDMAELFRVISGWIRHHSNAPEVL
jgi:hypothetical protein